MILWCEWCHNKTENNSYGNCKSCGAPRSEGVEKEERRGVYSSEPLFFIPHKVVCSSDGMGWYDYTQPNPFGVIPQSLENLKEVSGGVDLSSGTKDKTIMSLWDNIKQKWQHVVGAKSGNELLRDQDLGWDEDEWEWEDVSKR